MAKRIQALAQIVVDRTTATPRRCGPPATPTGTEVLRRLKGLPGFGEQKAKIFLALLGKQYGVTPKGWREAAGDYGKAGTFCRWPTSSTPDRWRRCGRTRSR